MSTGRRRKPEYPEESHAGTRKKKKEANFAQKGCSRPAGLNLEPSSRQEVTGLITAPVCPLSIIS